MISGEIEINQFFKICVTLEAKLGDDHSLNMASGAVIFERSFLILIKTLPSSKKMFKANNIAISVIRQKGESKNGCYKKT